MGPPLASMPAELGGRNAGSWKRLRTGRRIFDANQTLEELRNRKETQRRQDEGKKETEGDRGRPVETREIKGDREAHMD